MRKETTRILIQIALFLLTFITTTLAGTEWVYGRSIFVPDFGWSDFVNGLWFSVPLLLVLTVHEFGHYFMAMYHRVKTSLPYYIPIPPGIFGPFSLGTLGAVIRLRSRPHSNVENFDIGLAGPLAGFIVALLIMFYGFRTLPPAEYVFQFHPEYKKYGMNYADSVYTPQYFQKENEMAAKENRMIIDVQVGTNLLFWMFSHVADDPSLVPNGHEMMHYPVLLACYFALFVTCLNLLPIGQLDGGHVVYGLFGFKTHRVIATVFFVALVFYAGLGIPYIRSSYNEPIFQLPWPGKFTAIPLYILFLYTTFRGLGLPARDTLMYAFLMFTLHFLLVEFFPSLTGYSGWWLFAFITGRFIGVQHPPSEIERPLDPKRIALGWFTLLIFILCFSPTPLTIG